jgi:hypothetical protein
MRMRGVFHFFMVFSQLTQQESRTNPQDGEAGGLSTDYS